MENFEILHQEKTGPITEETFILEDSTGKLFYKEWLNEKGKVIDYQLRDKDGFSIDDPVIIQKIQNFLDSKNL